MVLWPIVIVGATLFVAYAKGDERQLQRGCNAIRQRHDGLSQSSLVGNDHNFRRLGDGMFSRHKVGFNVSIVNLNHCCKCAEDLIRTPKSLL